MWDSVFQVKCGAGVVTGGRRTELTGVEQRETISEVGPTRKGVHIVHYQRETT